MHNCDDKGLPPQGCWVVEVAESRLIGQPKGWDIIMCSGYELHIFLARATLKFCKGFLHTMMLLGVTCSCQANTAFPQ
jgi:hypothetical protein